MTYEQMIRFSECCTISVLREVSEFYGMNMLWFICGDNADWLGFMDDYGTFVPVDWC